MNIIKLYTDKDAIRDLESYDQRDNNKAFRYLYKSYFRMAYKLIKKRKGTENDAEDVFQEALLTLYENVKNHQFRGDSSLKTYFYSILRNQWNKKRTKNKVLKQYEKSYTIANYSKIDIIREIDDNHIEVKEILIDSLLDQVGPQCKRLLQYFYFENLPMKIIMQKMNFSNEQSARVQKYKCMQKLMNYLAEKPLVKRSIIEVI
jgi:RNA polymerase sigma factor (sigma-70 family)